jgi:hypothetical protein
VYVYKKKRWKEKVSPHTEQEREKKSLAPVLADLLFPHLCHYLVYPTMDANGEIDKDRCRETNKLCGEMRTEKSKEGMSCGEDECECE